MTDIPEDIREAAEEVLFLVQNAPWFRDEPMDEVEIIAQALLSERLKEREACSKRAWEALIKLAKDHPLA